MPDYNKNFGDSKLERDKIGEKTARALYLQRLMQKGDS